MSQTTVRFTEYERYDITIDSPTVLFMAITPKGTYSTEVVNEGGMRLHEKRSAFKEKAIELIASDTAPCKVEL